MCVCTCRANRDNVQRSSVAGNNVRNGNQLILVDNPAYLDQQMEAVNATTPSDDITVDNILQPALHNDPPCFNSQEQKVSQVRFPNITMTGNPPMGLMLVLVNILFYRTILPTQQLSFLRSRWQ